MYQFQKKTFADIKYQNRFEGLFTVIRGQVHFEPMNTIGFSIRVSDDRSCIFHSVSDIPSEARIAKAIEYISKELDFDAKEDLSELIEYSSIADLT